MKFTFKQYMIYDWHPWFAWHPVFVSSEYHIPYKKVSIVWLQRIERKRCSGRYYYRFPEGNDENSI